MVYSILWPPTEAIGLLDALRGTVRFWIRRDKSVRGTKSRRSQGTRFEEMVPGIAH